MTIDEKCIIFDTETTGFVAGEDEILQLSIIDGTGRILFDSYLKPNKKTSWAEAQRVNGISPDMVQNCQPISHHLQELQQIFDSAEILIAYNYDFDIQFLVAAGLKIGHQTVLDPMLDFAEIYGEWNDYFGDYKWQKLSTAAAYYDYEFKAHDSLEDVRATLHVARNIYKDK